MKRIIETEMASDWVVYLYLKDVSLPVCVCENESYAKAITELLRKNMPSKRYYYDSIVDPMPIDTTTTMPLI